MEDRRLLAAGIWTQQATLAASDGEAGDNFGRDVAVSGDTIVAGAGGDDDGAGGDDDGGNYSGSAYVFVRDGENWTEQAKLTASDPTEEDFFGEVLAISGDTIVAGVGLDDDACTNGSIYCDSGAVYVYVRNGTTWTQQAKLTASDAAQGDHFGDAVAISGDMLVVGAELNSDAGLHSGSAYVFVRSGTTWTEQVKLTASDAARGDKFGDSVAVSGDTVVVGSFQDGDNQEVTGSAYVFARSGTGWTQQAKLTANDAAPGAQFGKSVATSGETVVVGAHTDSSSAFASGSVYVFERTGTTWTQQAKLTASDGTHHNFLGEDVGISGDKIVAGAPNKHAAYVFEKPLSGWADAYEDTRISTAADRVDISGRTVVSGALLAAGQTGRAYVFVVANEAPTISSAAAINAAENQTFAVDVQSTDPDGETENGGGLTYSLTGGNDQGLFTVDSDSGLVTFNAAPNFEIPIDTGSDNVYDVQVTVTDAGGLTDVQDIAVTVTDVNEAPTVANPIADVEATEDAADDLLDLSGTFADVDAGDTLTLSIVGNTNSSLVAATIDGTDLTLDYLADQNGTAQITVQAIDGGGLSVEDTFTVTVLSAQEQIQILVDDVQDLGLNGGNTNALTSMLDNAIDNLDDGNTAAGVNQIEAFINQVNAKVNSGKLTQAEGDALIDAANAVITSALPGTLEPEVVDALFAELG